MKGDPVQIWGLKTCDRCRKTRGLLASAGHATDLRDLRDDPLSDAEIGRLLAVFGPDVLNRRSTTWRGLDEGERTAEPADLLRAHPALLRRPVLSAGGALYAGWDDAALAPFLT